MASLKFKQLVSATIERIEDQQNNNKLSIKQNRISKQKLFTSFPTFVITSGKLQ